MGKAYDAARAVVHESNPMTFMQRLRRMPVLGRVFAIIDRLL